MSALAVGSGMAAVNLALLACAKSGTRIVASRDLYGASVKLLDAVYRTLGVETEFVDIRDLEALEAALSHGEVRAVIAETISNPLLRVTDIAAVAERAHAIGARLIVDNTFATPYLLKPGLLGADYVVHSSTKYLGGHGDVTSGVVACSNQRRTELNDLNKSTGGIVSPFDAWLVLRGVKTLPLRMERQCRSAAIVADWLFHHPKLEWVYYPGLPGHESHETAREQFPSGQYGGMISFEIRDGERESVFRFLRALEMIAPATTLGDVYTLVLYPVMSSHRALTPEQRAQVGIGEGLVRLSIGIEDPVDIISDLERALDAV